MINPKSVILFQGDSVTDAGRTTSADPSQAMGEGYPQKIKTYIDTFCKEQQLTVYNRGVGGDRVKDLKARWEKDCIEINPDVLSILIGINDTWRRYDNNDPTSVESFEEDYRFIIKTAIEKCKCQVVLLEPFVVPTDPQKNIWYEDLIWKIQVVRKLAREFDLPIIPLEGIFASSSANVAPVHWSGDGVHPTNAGHALIAKLWIDMVLN